MVEAVPPSAPCTSCRSNGQRRGRGGRHRSAGGRRGAPWGDRGRGPPTGPALGATDAVTDGWLRRWHRDCGTRRRPARTAAVARGSSTARIPPSSSPATRTPTTRPATIDRMALISRGRVPVPAVGGASRGPLLPCRSHGRPPDLAPHEDRARHPDRARRHVPRRRPAVLHGPGRGRPAGHALAQPRRPRWPPPPSPLITLPPLASGGPPSAIPSIPADRVASRVRIAALKIDLPVIAAEQRLPGLQRGDVLRRPASRPARRGQADLPLRPRPDGHVPAPPDLLEGLERQQDEGHDRGGLDQRRPALPVRHHPGPAACAVRRAVHQAVRGQGRAALAPDAPRGWARSPSSRSSPSRSRRRPPRTRKRTPCHSR